MDKALRNIYHILKGPDYYGDGHLALDLWIRIINEDPVTKPTIEIVRRYSKVYKHIFTTEDCS